MSRVVRLPNESEADFQEQVLTIAGMYRWRSYHTHDSRRSTLGFPDLVLVRDVELIVAELKTDTGRVRPEQQVWLNELGRIGAAIAGFVDVGNTIWEGDEAPILDVYLWRPADWPAIEQRLKPRHRIAA